MDEKLSELLKTDEKEKTFRIRETDHAIVNDRWLLPPIMIDMQSPEDGSESQYADRAGVCNFLNRQEAIINAKQEHVSKMVAALHEEIEKAETPELKEALIRISHRRL